MNYTVFYKYLNSIIILKKNLKVHIFVIYIILVRSIKQNDKGNGNLNIRWVNYFQDANSNLDEIVSKSRSEIIYS